MKKMSNFSSNKLEVKNLKITNIYKIKNYLFMELYNRQKILTDGKKIYDISSYDNVLDIFFLNDKLCAVVTKIYSKLLIDLETMEILFDDKKAYQIYKQDEKTLHIIMNYGNGNDAIYNIETKKYLSFPENYEFEISLGNGLYVFREECDFNTDFYEYKRCVINADGKVIISDIEGWVELFENHLIIKNKDKLCIASVFEKSDLNIKIIEQKDAIISFPIFHNGFVFLIQKGKIEKYTPDFKLVEEFSVNGLEEVIDYEVVSDVLKLCLPYKKEEKQINKHLFFNLDTGKYISDIRIEGYPYWNPTTYISQDSINGEIKNIKFYNKDFELIKSLAANSYESVKDENENMFVIISSAKEKKYTKLFNAQSRKLVDIDYDYVQFHHSSLYGYGLIFEKETMDFLDEDLNVIIPNVDYKKFDLSFCADGFSYFIINNYVCIQKHFVGDGGRSIFRTIIQKSNGDILLDSVHHRCYAVGNFIQIVNNNESQFLNTITGEISILEIVSAVNEQGLIDFKNSGNINNMILGENNINLFLLDAKESSSANKLVLKQKKNDK